MSTGQWHLIFGGTFDPPHLGHDQMLKACVESSLVETVHLIPTFQNPLKAQSADRDMAPLGDSVQRKKWITLWVEDFKKRFPDLGKKIVLEFFELDSEKPSFTYDTLQKLKNDYPKKSWVLSLGDDQIEGLSKWHKVNALLQELHSVWVFSRYYNGDALRMIQAWPPELRGLSKIRIMAEPMENISSSEIRKQFRQAGAKLLFFAP